MRIDLSRRLVSALPPVAAACFLACVLAVVASVASATAYWSAIHAVVLSVDRRHRTLTIRHEALETVSGGIRICVVRDPRSLEHLRAGDIIEARAETSHAQWMLDGIRVVGRTGSAMRSASPAATALVGGLPSRV